MSSIVSQYRRRHQVPTWKNELEIVFGDGQFVAVRLSGVELGGITDLELRQEGGGQVEARFRAIGVKVVNKTSRDEEGTELLYAYMELKQAGFGDPYMALGDAITRARKEKRPLLEIAFEEIDLLKKLEGE